MDCAVRLVEPLPSLPPFRPFGGERRLPASLRRPVFIFSGGRCELTWFSAPSERKCQHRKAAGNKGSDCKARWICYDFTQPVQKLININVKTCTSKTNAYSGRDGVNVWLFPNSFTDSKQAFFSPSSQTYNYEVNIRRTALWKKKNDNICIEISLVWISRVLFMQPYGVNFSLKFTDVCQLLQNKEQKKKISEIVLPK